jgi:hypothetical protein
MTSTRKDKLIQQWEIDNEEYKIGDIFSFNAERRSRLHSFFYYDYDLYATKLERPGKIVMEIAEQLHVVDVLETEMRHAMTSSSSDPKNSNLVVTRERKLQVKRAQKEAIEAVETAEILLLNGKTRHFAKFGTRSSLELFGAGSAATIAMLQYRSGNDNLYRNSIFGFGAMGLAYFASGGSTQHFYLYCAHVNALDDLRKKYKPLLEAKRYPALDDVTYFGDVDAEQEESTKRTQLYFESIRDFRFKNCAFKGVACLFSAAFTLKPFFTPRPVNQEIVLSVLLARTFFGSVLTGLLGFSVTHDYEVYKVCSKSLERFKK